MSDWLALIYTYCWAVTPEAKGPLNLLPDGGSQCYHLCLQYVLVKASVVCNHEQQYCNFDLGTRLPCHRRADLEKNNHSCSHSLLLDIKNHQLMRIFELWDEVGAHGGNQCRHVAIIQTPDRQALSQITSPPCRTWINQWIYLWWPDRGTFPFTTMQSLTRTCEWMCVCMCMCPFKLHINLSVCLPAFLPCHHK